LNSEGDANLVQTKIPIFTLGRMDLWYCGMYVARTCRACIIGILGIVGVLHIMYFVFLKATVMILSTKMHPTSVGRGINFMFYIDMTLFSQHWWGAFLCSKSLLLPFKIQNT
jgi:hypothetical protein